jgi:hypothetical protein
VLATANANKQPTPPRRTPVRQAVQGLQGGAAWGYYSKVNDNNNNNNNNNNNRSDGLPLEQEAARPRYTPRTRMWVATAEEEEEEEEEEASMREERQLPADGGATHTTATTKILCWE